MERYQLWSQPDLRGIPILFSSSCVTPEQVILPFYATISVCIREENISAA